MRYPGDKIKQAILHSDIDIRDRGARYFAESFSTDTSLMPLLIQAMDTYGRRNDAYWLIEASKDSAQTAATIAWVLDQLSASRPTSMRPTLTTCRWSWWTPMPPWLSPGSRPFGRPAISPVSYMLLSVSECICSPGMPPLAGDGRKESSRAKKKLRVWAGQGSLATDITPPRDPSLHGWSRAGQYEWCFGQKSPSGQRA
jgi:hypothetical protein